MVFFFPLDTNKGPLPVRYRYLRNLINMAPLLSLSRTCNPLSRPGCSTPRRALARPLFVLFVALCLTALSPHSRTGMRGASAAMIPSASKCVLLFPSQSNKVHKDSADPLENGPTLRTGQSINFQFQFDINPPFQDTPRILTSVGYSQDVNGLNDRTTNGLRSYTVLASSDYYGCPLIYTDVVTSVSKSGFNVAVTRQPAAAGRLKNSDVASECFLRQMWPATMRVCYFAWEVGMLSRHSTPGTVHEGLTPIQNWKGENLNYQKKITLPSALIGNNPMVQLTVVGVNGYMSPITSSVSDVSNTSFTVHLSTATGNKAEPWGGNINVHLVWVVFGGRSLVKSPKDVEAQDGVYDVFFNLDPFYATDFKDLARTGVWMVYQDCDSITQVEKMEVTASGENGFQFRLPFFSTRRDEVIHFANAPIAKKYRGHNIPPFTISDEYALDSGPGVYELEYVSPSNTLRGAKYLKSANRTCFSNCSDHGTCVHNNSTLLSEQPPKCECHAGYFGCACSRGMLNRKSVVDAISVEEGFGARIGTTVTSKTLSNGEWPFQISKDLKPAHVDGYISRINTAGAVDSILTAGKWWPSDAVKLQQEDVALFCTPVVEGTGGMANDYATYATTHTYFYKEASARETVNTEPASYRINVMRMDGMPNKNGPPDDGFQFQGVRLPCVAFVPPMTAQQCKTLSDCSGHGICTQLTPNWQCTCNQGWAGANCSECDSGFNGDLCQPSCGGYKNCSGHGTCEGSGQRSANTSRCVCRSPFVQQNDTCKCDQCSGHGTCEESGPFKGKCECADGFDGSKTPYCGSCKPNYFGGHCKPCSVKAGGKLCAGHGECKDGEAGDGTCACVAGWRGDNCTKCQPQFYGPECKPCTSSCSGHGTCIDGPKGDGTCHCDSGWNGDPTCSTNSSSPLPAPTTPGASGSTGDGRNDNVPLPILIPILSAAVLAIAGLVYFLMKYRGSYFAIRKEENAGRGELMRELYMEINEAEAFMTQDGGDASFAQDWIVKFSSLTVGDIIGSGASGQVYRGMYSGQDVAIKRIVVSQWDRSAFMTSFRREAAILSRLHHPNIVRFFGVSIRPEDRNNSATFFIITEFCPSSLGAMLVDHAHNRRQAERAFLGGGLQDLVGVAATGGAGSVGHGSSARSTRNDKDDVEAFFKSDRRRLMCVLEICRGVAFLHKKNVVHRDLKPDNVLIDGSGRAKLCDFGLSRLMTGPESSLEAQGGGGGGGRGSA